jgi:glycerate kinase
VRVVIAPDSFGGTATAADAAAAIGAGWAEVAPADVLDLVPLSDGGPGFVSALANTAGAVARPVRCTGPTGRPVEAGVVLIGRTAYVESAMACGLDLLRAAGGDVRDATSYGVGELIAAVAAMPTVDTVVIGLGGSGTNDGGAGLWAALGAQPVSALRSGGVALRDLVRVVAPARPAPRLVSATDVDNPLLGLSGASAVYGPQKGADRAAVLALDAALERWADVVEAATGRGGLRSAAGAGAAGGLGFGLLALGAERMSGVGIVIDAVRLADRVDRADLVVTGEGRYDATSLRGKVTSGVAAVAQTAGVPCIVAAGHATVGQRDAAAHRIDEVWSVADREGSVDAALAAGVAGIRRLGAALAHTWSRPS